MDGTLAGIFLIASLTDMSLNTCPTGCLNSAAAEPRLGVQLAATSFNDDIIGQEIALTYDLPQTVGPFTPTLMAAVTDTGRVWVGAGARWSYDIGSTPFFIESSLLPGVDMGGTGPNLGGNLQFRSSLGLGYTFDNGATLRAAYDHRSNADTQAVNPGLETISIRYAFTWD